MAATPGSDDSLDLPLNEWHARRLACKPKAIDPTLAWDTDDTVSIRWPLPGEGQSQETWSVYDEMLNGAERFPTMVRLVQRPREEVRRAQRIAIDVTAPDFLDQLERFLAARLEGTHKVLPGTVRKDLTTLKWMVTRRLPQAEQLTVLTLLGDLQKGLRRREAARAARKALPLSPEAVQAFLRKPRPVHLRALMLLAWRTASRVEDVVALTKDSFRPVGTSDLLVVFNETKTNQEGDTRPDHEVVINDAAELLQWIPVLTQKLRPTDKLFTDSHSNELYRHLSRIPVPKAYVNDWQQLRPKNPLIQHFSLHSIKRGAAALLWEAAARGEISAQAVKYLLKHKSDETTVGYAPNPVHVSQAFGTSLATRVTRLG